MKIKNCLTVLAFMLMCGMPLVASAATAVDPTHQQCTTNDDCRLVLTSCDTCCPTADHSFAVNKDHLNAYKDMGQCTPEHIRACGVPECGLESPTAMPVCHEGRCEVMMGTYR